MLALSGARAARRAALPGAGIAAFAAIGGGTVRDLLLSHPILWIRDPRDLGVILATALLSIALRRQLPLLAPAA